MSPPRVSVVLPTYNRKDKLRECLESLDRQSLSPAMFEVIIVDDGSTDGTMSEIRDYQQKSKLHITGLSGGHAGPGAARNLGVRHARAEVIGFIEDDVVAETHWLERADAVMDAKRTDCLEGVTLEEASAGPVRVFDDPGSFSFIPCNLFVRKEVFLKLGGYDERFFDRSLNLYFREDADLGFRILAAGYTVTKAADVIVTHPVQYSSPGDAFKHVRRFYFDPLLYAKNPVLFRKLLEAKKIGALHINRPFHYLSLFHLLFFLVILSEILANNTLGMLIAIGLLLIVHAGIRYRYERSLPPRLWKIADTAMFFALPFYYMYWLLRGCNTFKEWRCLL